MSTIANTITSAQPLTGAWTFTAPLPVYDAVTVTGSFLGGRNFAPRKDELLADVAAEMLDEGTKRRSKKQIQETLDRYGMSISFGVTGDRLGFTAQCRRDHLPVLLPILAEELHEPAFPAKELAEVKKRLMGGIVQSKEDTRTQGTVALTRLLYDADHPNYELTPEQAMGAIQSITREKLVRFYKSVAGRGSLILIASGDITASVFSHLVKQAFADLPVPSVVAPQKRGKQKRGGGRAVVTIPKKTSVDLLLGVPLPITKDHPDFYSLVIASRILGVPGFAGRLMQVIREKMGLTYVLYARLIGFEGNHEGHLEIAGSFAPELLKKGMEATLAEYRRFYSKGVTAKEVADQKSMIKGSHLISLSTTKGRASAIRHVIEEGKTPEFLDQYLSIIEKVTVADVNRVIRRYLDQKKLAIVAAGSIEKSSLSF